MVAVHDAIDLKSILDPYTPEVFFQEYCGQNFLNVAGSPARFSKLLSWAALNDLLEHHEFKASHLSLIKDGISVSPQSFTAPGDGLGPNLLAPVLTAYLRGGATLSIDGIDELYGPATRLARSLERDIGVRVKVRLFVGFASRRIPSHWDEDHTIKLQVTGKTKWEIGGEAYGFPPAERNLQTMSLPQNRPLWEGVLSAGDALYIPRGWWYSGSPCGEPAIHLSVGFRNPTGLNLLQWLTENLKAQKCIRDDLPRFAGQLAKHEYLEAVRGAVAQAIEAPGLLDRFFAQADAQAQVRPSFALPASATPSILPEPDGYIELLVLRGLDIRLVSGEQAIEASGGGIVARFHPSAAPLLNYLNQNYRPSIAQFQRAFEEVFNAGQLRDFLTNLVEHGLISIKDRLDGA